MPLNPPAFSPPAWPRLGRRTDAGPAIGGLAPAPVEIPVCWLGDTISLRLEKPLTTARVSRSGSTAISRNDAALATFGDNPFTALLSTVTGADPSNLAHWTITYRAAALMRSPGFTINLLIRSDDEKLMLLRIVHGQRIKLTGVPPEFPEGASSLVVTGIGHDIGVTKRTIRFTTSQVIGVAPGVPGPWFRLGSSSTGGTDIVPF